MIGRRLQLREAVRSGDYPRAFAIGEQLRLSEDAVKRRIFEDWLRASGQTSKLVAVIVQPRNRRIVFRAWRRYLMVTASPLRVRVGREPSPYDSRLR